MKIHHGSNRTAIVAGNWVFKFPSWPYLAARLKDVIRSMWRRDWASARTSLNFAIFTFLRGVIANLTEFALWVQTRSSFLVPVIFSFGFVSVQRFEKGERPTDAEIYAAIKKLPKLAVDQTFMMDGHALHSHNWKKNEKGYRLFDYGDNFADTALPLSLWIMSHHEEMSKVFRLSIEQPS